MSKTLRNILVCLLGLAALLGAAILWYFRAVFFAPERTFDEIRALIGPHIEILTPPGIDGQRPAILFFHGCGGPLDYTIERAAQVLEQGYVAVVVDSYTGRQVDWELSCAGRVLPGYQRAADVLVALDIARHHPSINPEQLFLVGYSHGGWTILEALATGNELPEGLLDSPGNHLAGVRGLVAWYPYCGFVTRFHDGWDSDVPVLMLLAEEDHTTAAQPCVDVAKAQADLGKPVSWDVYAGVDHGFDLQEDWVRVYDPIVHAQAMRRQTEFLTRYTESISSGQESQ